MKKTERDDERSVMYGLGKLRKEAERFIEKVSGRRPLTEWQELRFDLVPSPSADQLPLHRIKLSAKLDPKQTWSFNADIAESASNAAALFLMTLSEVAAGMHGPIEYHPAIARLFKGLEQPQLFGLAIAHDRLDSVDILEDLVRRGRLMMAIGFLLTEVAPIERRYTSHVDHRRRSLGSYARAEAKRSLRQRIRGQASLYAGGELSPGQVEARLASRFKKSPRHIRRIIRGK